MRTDTISYDHVIDRELLSPIGQLGTHHVGICFELNHQTGVYKILRISFTPAVLGMVTNMKQLLRDISCSVANNALSQLNHTDDENEPECNEDRNYSHWFDYATC
jgi:hypothetical protein